MLQTLKTIAIWPTHWLLALSLVVVMVTALAPTPVALAASSSSQSSSGSCDKGDSSNCDLIKLYINPAINMLTVAFAIIVVISLIIGGINYTTSEGDPQKVSRAKNRIFNTIFALIAYIFLYSFLQFLIPGGAFH